MRTDTTDAASTPSPTARDGAARPWRDRRFGEWLALAVALYLIFNAARAVVDPSTFAAYVGLPVLGATGGGSPGEATQRWILVYASRSVVLAVIALVLLAVRQRRALGAALAAAVLAPVTDAALTSAAGASAATIGRHIGIAAVLALIATLLLTPTRPPRAASGSGSGIPAVDPQGG